MLSTLTDPPIYANPTRSRGPHIQRTSQKLPGSRHGKITVAQAPVVDESSRLPQLIIGEAKSVLHLRMCLQQTGMDLRCDEWWSWSIVNDGKCAQSNKTRQCGSGRDWECHWWSTYKVYCTAKLKRKILPDLAGMTKLLYKFGASPEGKVSNVAKILMLH